MTQRITKRILIFLAACLFTACHKPHTSNPPLARTSLEEASSWIQRELDGSGRSKDPFYIALSTMNFVQSRMSPYVFQSYKKQGIQICSNTESCLASGSGLCGSQMFATMRLLHEFGVKNRAVQMYQIDESGIGHAVLEVYFNDKWNLFDVSYGTFFKKPRGKYNELLSMEEVLNTPRNDFSKLPITNLSEYVFALQSHAGLKPTEYYLSHESDIILDGNGTIRIRPKREAPGNSGEVSFTLANIPRYIGKVGFGVDEDFLRKPSELQYRITEIPSHIASVTLSISTVECSSGALIGRQGDRKTTFPISPVDSEQTFIFPLKTHPLQRPEDLNLSVVSEGSSSCLFRVEAISGFPISRSVHRSRGKKRS